MSAATSADQSSVDGPDWLFHHPSEPQREHDTKPLTSVDRTSTEDAPHTCNPKRPYVRHASRAGDDVFHVLQLWEGKVLEVRGDDFVAQIIDKTDRLQPEEIVEIDREEVPLDDQPLVHNGAIFYWSVGYEEGARRPRRRVSQIRFRRLPAMSMHEIDQAARRAAQYSDLFSN